ncbi:MAG: 30S ribosomal protein S17 [Candidatus Riflebacteria bacterium]|nr:30S ribosomal protein S17 [Candidatus Riflebacteria bacterium]
MEKQEQEQVQEKAIRKTIVGRVISANSSKTLKVEVEGIVQHTRYRKYIKRSRTFMVHDPKSECKLGDKIRIEESRPISKLKKWVVREVLERATAKSANTVKEASADDPAGINS